MLEGEFGYDVLKELVKRDAAGEGRGLVVVVVVDAAVVEPSVAVVGLFSTEAEDCERAVDPNVVGLDVKTLRKGNCEGGCQARSPVVALLLLLLVRLFSSSRPHEPQKSSNPDKILKGFRTPEKITLERRLGGYRCSSVLHYERMWSDQVMRQIRNDQCNHKPAPFYGSIVIVHTAKDPIPHPGTIGSAGDVIKRDSRESDSKSAYCNLPLPQRG